MNTVLRKRRLPSWIKKQHSQKFKNQFPFMRGKKKALIWIILDMPCMLSAGWE